MPKIPGYRMVRKVGEGGFGAVYLAVVEETGNEVAVKTMLQTRQVEQRSLDQFEREIEVSTALAHENVVQVFDSGIHEGLHYFVLEYMNGGSARDLLTRRGKIPYPECLPIMRQTLAALAYAHSRDIIHRDLKPENILLSSHTGGWKAKVADFGLAKNFAQAGFTRGSLTRVGTFCGSPPYMAPEHLQDYRFVKPPTDVFEMAATFYHMLTGHTVWETAATENPFLAILEGEVRSIGEREPGLPSGVVALLDRALSRDPEDRYLDGGALLAALAEVS
jgi:serine/threonine protein kinase